LSRDSFRKAIYDIIEFFTRYQLSDQAKKLVLYYFNETRHNSSYIRALSSIRKYTQEEIPSYDDAPLMLKELLDKLAEEAEAWDQE
jgi:hypothetical protein